MGQIQSLDPQGAIMVKWPSGEVTRCYPQELYIVGDEVWQKVQEREIEREREREREREMNLI